MPENGEMQATNRRDASPVNGVIPPPEKRWKKGQSGNPKGRPMLTDLLRKVIESPDPDDPTKTTAQRLVETVRKAAMRGDWKFVELIFDRIDGPVLRAAIGQVNVNTAPTYILEGECWHKLVENQKGNNVQIEPDA
jgi:hypothetical protein